MEPVKYREYKNLNYAKVGEEILSYWKENNIFAKSVQTREGKPSFTFYEGPPSANGTPGIHHVMARAVKDIFCRFKTMQGFQVKRKGGWDTHGLPVELQVEKELGMTKEDIGQKITVEEYNRKCREAVMKYTDEWENLTDKMGYWVDMDDPYITYERDYMETVWHLLKKFHQKGLLYKGYTIQPFSPAAGTGLSSHELNQPGCYRMVKDTSMVAQFKVKKTDHPSVAKLFEQSENVYFLAWTTTPWTLPANNGLAVGENIDYVKIKTYNQYTYQLVEVILAKVLVPQYFNPKARDIALEDYKPGDKLIPYQVADAFKGSELVGISYEQLLPYVPLPDPAFTVVPGDFVTTEDGTGIVHIAKTFGADDYRTSVKHNMPGVMVKDAEGNDVPIVDRQGKFVQEITDFAGMYVKNYEGHDESDPDYRPTDVLIAIKLKEENKAFKVEKYEHSYPHCWRTDKPVLYYPLDSWFIKTTAFKDQLVALNNTINWKPASTGTGRFGNWLENLVDWNLSRSRYWGTPLPIWVSEDRKEEKCIGSLAELMQEVEKSVAAGFMNESLPDDFDLHRPFVDEVVLVSDSGQKMYREPDLIDVWFDSGSMPYAQWHFPFENKEIFEANYPADFIAEGVDQTRGWFFTLHAIAGMLFDQVAFKNVIANGLVLDKNGNKMSKRLGNAIDPFKTIAEYGPDATRWYMITNANPWDNLKFNLDGVLEVQRRFFGTLQNTYSFFALYANIDGFRFDQPKISLHERVESDRWVISKLHSLIKVVNQALEDYEPTRAGRAIQDFVIDDLSNWYVRLNRKRFWKPADKNDGQTIANAKDKVAAYQTLYECLITVAKLAAPIAPFYAEQLYLDLNRVARLESEESVHLTTFPQSNPPVIDKNLEEKMTLAQRISSLVHSLRKSHKIKVRQPLSKILVPVMNQKIQKQIHEIGELIRTEVNIKEIEFIDDTSGILVKKIKPNFKKLGKEYGPKMKDIAKAVQAMSQDEINQMERDNLFRLPLQDQPIELTLEDVEISFEDIPGWSVATEGNVTVALDITLTNELKQEGIARDLVNRIQNMRKDIGLEVQDKIRIAVENQNQIIHDALITYKDYICTETQALQLTFEQKLSEGNTIEIDDFQFNIKIALE
ncbi:MAG: isoleucine--tRNA ligase [Candidatus Cyclobacteriaceae bacterium M3_2C_046]